MKKILLILTVLLAGCQRTNTDLYRQILTYDEYLDTITKIVMYHHENQDLVALEEGIIDILKETHQIYDSHSETSELGILNATAHLGPVEVSEDLFKIIKLGIDIAIESDGAYDPTIAPLADLWEIDDDSKWDEIDAIPTEEEIQLALGMVDYTKVILNEENKTVFFSQEGIKLDLGGIAKGYITSLLKDFIVESGVNNGIVNVGSSSQLPIGTRCVEKEATLDEVTYEDTGAGWRIGTSDPYDVFGFKQIVGIFPLQDVALSSSGSSQRFFILDGIRYHHIYDTKTGYPVDNDLILIQVKSDDIIGIDAISTMLYVYGYEKALNYIETHDGIEALFITYDKEVYFSSGFGEFEPYSEEYNINN